MYNVIDICLRNITKVYIIIVGGSMIRQNLSNWFLSLSVMEQIYFWLAAVATLFLIVQIILMCCSSFGGDVDLDGDGDIDVDGDSGVSIFTVKSITAFFAVGGWTGLLTCALASEKLQWLSIITAFIAGAAAMAVVVVTIRAILKLQCNGAVQTDKLVGLNATVYVSVPPSRSGHGKVTLTAQGRYMEFDALTDEQEKLPIDETVRITSFEGDCLIVNKLENKN